MPSHQGIYYHLKPGEGTTILFLHGWGSNHSVWTPYIDHFKNPVLVVDLRGHGKSEEGDNSVQSMADDVRAILVHEQISDYHCVGHSLGACVGSQLAKVSPPITFTGINLYSKEYGGCKHILPFFISFFSWFFRNTKYTFQFYYKENGKPVHTTLLLDLKGTAQKTLVNSFYEMAAYQFTFPNVKTLVIQGYADPLSKNRRIKKDAKKNKVMVKQIAAHHLITTYNAGDVMDILEEFWS